MVDAELIRMEVKGLMLDPTSNMPIVILRSDEPADFLPIWIGVSEANAIALKLEDVDAPRPMTHDLAAALLAALDAEVVRIIVSDLQESTFFARIVLNQAGEELTVDARPSDAIAIALRVEAPIFVTRDVLERARLDENRERLSDEQKIKKWLEEIDPDDLGKYTM